MAQSLQADAAAVLDGKNVAYVRKPKSMRVIADKEMIEQDEQLFRSVATLVKKSWDL
jgi:hypothetical protein